MKNILLVFFIFLCCRIKSAEKIKFIGEDIRIFIDSNVVSVFGSYFFRNDSNQEVLAKIFYPFPIDQYHCYPESIFVEEFVYLKNDSGIDLIMRFKAIGIDTLKIFYRQKLKRNQARYILTTTKNWKIPLQRANFIIDMPDNLKRIKFSYRPDSVHYQGMRKSYYITKKDFMPKQDLIIRW
ncbi:MAG: DUF4424 family protein [candidate division WOR-3 bacterium]